MIKISSFYPFADFRRATYEFHEEKAVVKIKSLRYEREFEFQYKDIGEISDAFYADMNQRNFGFWMVLLSVGTMFVAYRPLHAHPILLWITEVIFLGGLLLYLTAFKRNWLFEISDRNSNGLVTIQDTRRNHDLLSQALELIRNRSSNLRELTVTNPFPEEKPLFEHSDFNPAGMSRTIDKIYGDRIIGLQKSLYGETIYNIPYDRLNGEVYRGKSGSGISEAFFGVGIVILMIIAALDFGFRIKFGISAASMVKVLAALYFLSLPFDLIKREIIGLYDKNGNIEYWTHVNKANKENVEEMIRFIQSKISPVTDNELLKEQA